MRAHLVCHLRVRRWDGFELLTPKIVGQSRSLMQQSIFANGKFASSLNINGLHSIWQTEFAALISCQIPRRVASGRLEPDQAYSVSRGGN
jgi:hypothetical protein